MTASFATYQRQAADLRRQLRLLRQTHEAAIAPTRSPIELAIDVGVALDPWQRRALSTTARNILLLSSRQAGKSTVSAIMALHTAVYDPGSLVLILSPGERQSKRLLRVIRRYYSGLRTVAPTAREGLLSLEFRNGSEIHALPGREGTIRGYSDVDLLIVDEAARVPDELYSAVRPMLAVSGGRLIALSTPFGKRGWFWEAHERGGDGWHRERVTAHEIARISKAFLDAERMALGPDWFAQEYECAFLDALGQLFAGELIESLVSGDILPLFGGGEDQWSRDLISTIPAL